MTKSYQVVVVGGGQAGLVFGYYLKRAGVSYVILSKEKRIGETWRQRYDSLVLFTPRWMSRLPGQAGHGNLNPNGYADKDEIADELEAYAAAQQLNIQLDTEVTKLTKVDGKYVVETTADCFRASCVVIATGPFQQPFIPNFAGKLSNADVVQVHTSTYKNINQLKAGEVLIVGSGNSGAQIAVELSGQRRVYLSASQEIAFVPKEIGGKSIFWWFRKLGLYRFHVHTKIGQKLSRNRDPIIGTELKGLIRQKKISLRPRAIQATCDEVIFEDGTALKVANVIWATGFVSDYGWIDIPGVIDERGKPIHRRGVSEEQGLFFLGLPWQYNRGSALIGGVAADAEYILDAMISE